MLQTATPRCGVPASVAAAAAAAGAAGVVCMSWSSPLSFDRYFCLHAPPGSVFWCVYAQWDVFRFRSTNRPTDRQ
uniref:Putative secreted protein n=1 Tax=Anopheles darlingi TaxID=43151 RepID=A0A2M4DKN8_ANODA